MRSKLEKQDISTLLRVRSFAERTHQTPESVWEQACQIALSGGFKTLVGGLEALERGAHKPLALPRRTPLLQRDPQLALKLIAAASIALNLLLVWLLLAR